MGRIDQQGVSDLVIERQKAMLRYLEKKQTGKLNDSILAWAFEVGLSERKSSEYFRKVIAAGYIEEFKNDNETYWRWIGKEEETLMEYVDKKELKEALKNAKRD